MRVGIVNNLFARRVLLNELSIVGAAQTKPRPNASKILRPQLSASSGFRTV